MKCLRFRIGAIAVGLLAGGGAMTPAAEPPAPAAAPISYFRDIRPIFQEQCHGCHQPAKAGGEYVMTVFDRLVAGGESGEAAIVPGKPSESSLLRQVTPVGERAEMPKDKPPLASVQVDLIARWIEQGAADDSPPAAARQYDMQHPPEYTAPPLITSLNYSADGQYLAISGYHEVVLYHADGRGLAARLVGLSERIESAVFSPDSQRLAVTGGSPGRMGELQIWDVAARELKLSLTVGYDTIYGGSWSGDGKLVAFGCPDNTVRAVDTNTGQQVLFNGAHNDWVLDTVFSQNSDYLITVSRDMSMKLIQVGTQQFIDNITSITPGALKGGLHAVARRPGTDELLCGGADGVPKLYRMIREKARQIGDDFNLLRAFPGMPGRVFCAAFSPDGTKLVAGSSLNGAGEVRIYEVAEAKQLHVLPIPTGGIFAVDFSADGKTVAAGGFDGQVRLIDVATGQIVRTFLPVDLQVAAGGAAPVGQ